MANRFGKNQSGFTLFELAISLIIFAVLAAILLWRAQQYYGEAERLYVQRTVDSLRAALAVRLTRVPGNASARTLARIAEENPFDWLVQKPDNYLGEYYSPELKEMHTGNWVFDRRDKTLIYLVNSDKSFTSGASNFLKFKVEFAQARMPGRKNGPEEVPSGLKIVQIDDRPATTTD
jgi:general secretion pathway protein G